MKIFQFSKTVLLTAILVGSLSAESVSNEDDVVESKCNVVYDACLADCDKSDDGSEECYKSCEDAFANCPDVDSQEEGK